MAKILYEVKQNKNQFNTGYGKWYAKVKALETLNTRNGANKKEDYNPNKHMKALHIRFLPEQTTEENISSREFIKQAEFVNVDSLLKAEDENGSGSDSDHSDVPPVINP